MNNFIIVTKALKINLFSFIFINKEIKRLHDKHCKLGIYHNNTHMVLVRELDDTMFWDTNFDAINYKHTNKEAINNIFNNFPSYLNYPVPRIDSYIK